MTQPFLPSNLPKRTDGVCSHKDEHTNVHNSFIGNNKKLKTASPSTDENKIVLHPLNRTLCSRKKELWPTYMHAKKKTQMSLKIILPSERSQITGIHSICI